MKLLRVGIIGASADRGWAREPHVPAVQLLAGVELTAVAISSQETADAAATAFGAKKAYGKATDLFQVCQGSRSSRAGPRRPGGGQARLL